MKINIKIVHDQDCESPLEDNELVSMALFHQRYSLPNTHDVSAEHFSSWDAIESHIAEVLHAPVILPVYMLDNWGLAFSTRSFNDPWDSEQVGFIYATRDCIKECFGVKRITQELKDRVAKQLESALEEYSVWQAGECYGYQIEDEAGNIVDSCYGYIGRDVVNWAAIESVSTYVGANINNIEVEY